MCEESEERGWVTWERDDGDVGGVRQPAMWGTGRDGDNVGGVRRPVSGRICGCLRRSPGDVIAWSESGLGISGGIRAPPGVGNTTTRRPGRGPPAPCRRRPSLRTTHKIDWRS
jgi:hypothetical protein